MSQSRELIASGKTKTLYRLSADQVVMEFGDQLTAYTGQPGAMESELPGKAAICAAINTYLMQQLHQMNIPTHFIEQDTETSCIVKPLQMIKVECIVRNYAAGSLCKRLGIESGKKLNNPVFELFLKDDALGDPFINAAHCLEFGWANANELKQMEQMSIKINQVLFELFANCGLMFVDVKFEFGWSGNVLLLGDEITPDSFRLWTIAEHKILDKDRFRKNLGDVLQGYRQIAEQLGIASAELSS